MKGCISFSLYGDGAKYAFGMLENIRLAPEIYPEWTVVIHAERGHYAIPKMRSMGAEVIEMDPVPGSRGMFWRFLPLEWSERFTHVIVRDADSRLNVRDKACTDEWIASGKDLHVIRDHPAHEFVAILGGAWGAKTGKLNIRRAIREWRHTNEYGDDEKFLGEFVWPQFSFESFLRHSYEPKCSDDTPIPEHAHYKGFVCEPVAPKFGKKFRAVVLSPEKYAARRKRFFKSLETNGGFLKNSVAWFVGTTLDERVVPRHFDYAEEHPHYYLASQDHIEIIEKAILGDVDYLFVFEDDALFAPDFEEFFFRAWVALPEDWKSLMLGGQPETDSARKVVSEESARAIASVHGCLGMHGVLWSRSGLRRAYDHFDYWNRCTVDQAFAGLQGDESGHYAPAKWIVQIDPLAIQFGQDS